MEDKEEKREMPRNVFELLSPEAQKKALENFTIIDDSAGWVAKKKAEDKAKAETSPPNSQPKPSIPGADKPMTGKPATLLDKQIQELEEKKESQGLTPEEEKKLAKMKETLGVENEPGPDPGSAAAAVPDKKTTILDLVKGWLDDDRR